MSGLLYSAHQRLSAALGSSTLANDVITEIESPAKVLRTRVATADVNAGYTLLPAVAGYKYRVHDVALIAVGGAATGATTIDVSATQSSSAVKLLAAAVAGLTQNTLLRAGATNAAILAAGASFIDNDTNTAVTLGKTGSSLATATHIDVLLTYTLTRA